MHADKNKGCRFLGGGDMKKTLVLFVLTCSLTAAASAHIFEKLSKFNEKNREDLSAVFNNFYVVEEGVFYRSQLLKIEDLAKYVKKYNIKTVVNLRGDRGAAWWKAENELLSQAGIEFYSLGVSAIYLITRDELLSLLAIYQCAPRPILVHCIGGADRTGEACALWVLDRLEQKRIAAHKQYEQGSNEARSQLEKDKIEARKQLDIRYGHRKYKNSAKDVIVEIWQGREWAIKEYDHRKYPDFCRPEQQSKPKKKKEACPPEYLSCF